MDYYYNIYPQRFVICQTHAIPRDTCEEINILQEEIFKSHNYILELEEANYQLKIENENYKKTICYYNEILSNKTNEINNLTELTFIIKNEFDKFKKSLSAKYNDIIKNYDTTLSLLKINHKKEVKPLYDSLHDIKIEYNNLKKTVKKTNNIKEKLLSNEKIMSDQSETIINMEKEIKNYLNSIFLFQGEIDQNRLKLNEDDIIKKKYIKIIKQLKLNNDESKNIISILQSEIKNLTIKCSAHEAALIVYKHIIFDEVQL